MCSSGEATPKDRERMYGWNKPSAKERERYQRGNRGRPPGRGSTGRNLPLPRGEGKRPKRDDPWHWFTPRRIRLVLAAVLIGHVLR